MLKKYCIKSLMDYYKILNIDRNTDKNVIKKQWRKMAFLHHPDRNGGDEEMFKKINEAYHKIIDNNNDVWTSNIHPTEDLMFNPEDIFKAFFNNFSENQIKKPQPIIKTIAITLQDAFTGINYPIEIQRYIDYNQIKTFETEKLYINIHSGIDNNEIILINNKGNIFNNIQGDLKIIVKINNNTKFIRNGLNLQYKHTITLKEALLGFKFELEFINNQTYTINNSGNIIIYPGFKKIIKEMGMSRQENKGNLIIEFDIKFPKKLNNYQKNILKKLI
ncbi:DnaJ domain-containing protein [bacterium]|nr:DnaJ domain-containing protein [bacterium]